MHALRQTKVFHTWIAVASWRIERMEEVDEIVTDSDSEHDEILCATIMYKTDRTYDCNLSKDRKKAIWKRAEWFEIVKGELVFLRKDGKQPENQNHHQNNC